MYFTPNYVFNITLTPRISTVPELMQGHMCSGGTAHGRIWNFLHIRCVDHVVIVISCQIWLTWQPVNSHIFQSARKHCTPSPCTHSVLFDQSICKDQKRGRIALQYLLRFLFVFTLLLRGTNSEMLCENEMQ